MIDKQAQAFRDAPPSDWAAQAAMLTDATHYPAGTDPNLTPEQYEARQWDAERGPAKTLDDARTALAARIADPAAPDDPSVRGAYDDLTAGDLNG